jgi:hypothetical protein
VLAVLVRAGPHVRLNVLDVSVAVRTPNESPCSRRSTPHLAPILHTSCTILLVCLRRAYLHTTSCTSATPARCVISVNSPKPLARPRTAFAPRHAAAHLAH